MLTNYAVSHGVARITLNRAEKRNALSPELIASLHASLEQAAQDPEVKVVLLDANGPDFCAGMDLAGLVANENADATTHLAEADRIANLCLALRRHPHPVIAAVQGRALGGGCGLATACDMVVAADTASFRYSEVDLGFVAAIVMAILTRSVGEKQAFELLASADSFTAADALRLGIINHVCPQASFAEDAQAFAAKFAHKSSSAVRLTKRLLYHMDGMSFAAAVEAGVFVNAAARNTSDARAGIARFVRK